MPPPVISANLPVNSTVLISLGVGKWAIEIERREPVGGSRGSEQKEQFSLIDGYTNSMCFWEVVRLVGQMKSPHLVIVITPCNWEDVVSTPLSLQSEIP